MVFYVFCVIPKQQIIYQVEEVMKYQNQCSLKLLALSFVLSVSLPVVSALAQGGSGELPGAKPGTKGGAKPPVKPGGPAAPAAPVILPLAFDQEVKSRIDPKSSDKTPSGQFFEEFSLIAKSDDLLSFQLQSEIPTLNLQLFDKDKTEIPTSKDTQTGNFKITTESGGLPLEGEYRLRVSGAVTGKIAIPFSVTVSRLGLLPAVYNDRFQQIIMNYREDDPASVDQTLPLLEQLAKDDPGKSGAFEFLGIIYLYNKGDLAKAEAAMEQAINAKGAAVIKILYDSQWRRIVKLKTGKFGFEDPKTGWVRIRPGQLMLTDASNKSINTVSGTQIKEMSKVVTNLATLVTMTVEGVRRQLVFLPGTRQAAEADLVIKLVQTHVMGKSN